MAAVTKRTSLFVCVWVVFCFVFFFFLRGDHLAMTLGKFPKVISNSYIFCNSLVRLDDCFAWCLGKKYFASRHLANCESLPIVHCHAENQSPTVVSFQARSFGHQDLLRSIQLLDSRFHKKAGLSQQNVVLIRDSCFPPRTGSILHDSCLDHRLGKPWLDEAVRMFPELPQQPEVINI